MSSRRKFIRNVALSSAAFTVPVKSFPKNFRSFIADDSGPVVVSTWNFGQKANEAAWNVLQSGGSGLDAIEAGIHVPEADPAVTSVGYGGYPDRDGIVTLDACIMDDKGNAGSVCAMEDIMHPITVARMVMEKTPHVIIVGEGARQVAIDNGMETTKLLTADAEKAWKDWLTSHDYKPKLNWEQSHDTIGMLCRDANGNLFGGCSTSGMAFKMHGRVGDSPIIGAGLFVDNEIGAATATGNGEYMIKTAGAHTVVEYMRQGMSPTDACRLSVERIVNKYPDVLKDIQVGFLAMNKAGEFGGYGLHKGYTFAHYNNSGFGVSDAEFIMD